MLPRFNSSDWKLLENTIGGAVANVKKGNYKLEIQIDYAGSPDPRIPRKFVVHKRKRVMGDEWEDDGASITRNHEVVEPTLSPERRNQIVGALASVHRPEDAQKVKVETAFRNHLLVRHSMREKDADDAAASLREHWHLPPLDRCYPDSSTYRPYEELDLLYLEGKLGIAVSRVQRPSEPFTLEQRKLILEYNRARNGGVLRSDDPRDRHPVLRVGGTLDRPEIDHIVPKGRGGSNYFSNAKVISFEMNNKGERVKNPGPYFEPGAIARRNNPKWEEDVMDVLSKLRRTFEPLERIVGDVCDRRREWGTTTRKRRLTEIANMLDLLVADGIVERMVEISDDTGEELGDAYRMREIRSLRRMAFPL